MGDANQQQLAAHVEDDTAAVFRPRSKTVTPGIDQSMLPVYQQKWWIDIARGTQRYREAQVFADGIVIGSLPYIVKRSRLGLLWGASPDWSHVGGPVLSDNLPDEEKSNVLRRLIAQLPQHISYGFRCSPNSIDKHLIREAFKGAGFVHFTEVTYSQAPDEADVMARLSRKHRLHIKSAAKLLDITEISEVEFISFYTANLKDARVKSLASLDVARHLIAKGRQCDPPQVRVMAARRKAAGAPLDAAVACVWDQKRYYFWMSTRRRHTDDSPHEKPHPDAIKLLIVDAMAHAKALGLVFDADGVSTPGAKTLYNEILRIPNEEFRDVFERMSKLALWYRTSLQRFKNFAVTHRP